MYKSSFLELNYQNLNGALPSRKCSKASDKGKTSNHIFFRNLPSMKETIGHLSTNPLPKTSICPVECNQGSD